MNNSSSSGVGILGITQVVFLILKWTNLIDWSWWWIWSPMLFSIGLFILGFLIAVIAVVIGASSIKKNDSK